MSSVNSKSILMYTCTARRNKYGSTWNPCPSKWKCAMWSRLVTPDSIVFCSRNQTLIMGRLEKGRRWRATHWMSCMILRWCARDLIDTGTLITCRKRNLDRSNANQNQATSSSQYQETKTQSPTSPTNQLQTDQLLKVLSHRQIQKAIMAYKLRISSGNAVKAILILLNSA